MGRDMEDERVKISKKWLQDLSKGIQAHQLDALVLGGLQVLQVHRGFIRCNFVVSNRISDKDGNWEAGAMATLIDDVGAAAISSLVGPVKSTVDFSISYFSPAKIQEEVEIEAKVVGKKGKLMSVVMEVRRKSNGELIALGKQWMATTRKPSKL